MAELCALLEAQFAERAFGEALATAEALIETEPSSAVGLRCQCACLVQLARADEALTLLDGHADAFGTSIVLPRGFSLYQKGELRDALQLLESALALASSGSDEGGGSDERAGMLHLVAQVHYKMGAYAEAAKAYRRVLAEDPSAAEDEEVCTNATAAYVMAGLPADALRLVQTQQQTRTSTKQHMYELVYNSACAHIVAGDLAQAEERLEEALSLSSQALQADEADDEEVAAEQAPIRVQKAFVAHSLGREADAQEGYLSVLRMKGHEAVDSTVAAVAANNLVALRGDRDLFDSAKRCKAALTDAVAAKLLPSQKLCFLANQVILTWHMGKPTLCREQLNALNNAFPESEVPVLLRAALLFRPKATSKEQPSVEAEECLAVWACKHPKIAARPLLALAQMQAHAPLPTAKGHVPIDPLRKAARTLAAIDQLRLSPRLVATVAALLERLGDVTAAADFLNETLDKLGRNKSILRPFVNSADAEGGSEGLQEGPLLRKHILILRGASTFFERHGLWHMVAQAQQQLLVADPRDISARARMVVAASHFDPNLAAEHDELLPEVVGAGEEEDVDVEALENLQLSVSNRHSSAVAASGKATGKRWVGDDVATPDPGMGPNKRRKKRKPRLPKDFDPAKPGLMPDAERWLPTKERSTYRKTKRDKKNAAQMRGPQGATVSAALDISTAKSTATAAAGSSATQLGEGGRNKKKKGGKKGAAAW
mmetsp:Transcript_10399/g.26181  ORF Transcript_10399/g.26181 Transcript_10399/m.26181 type:complete len:717 (+) Transcript_10399:3-2153(+)